MTKLVRALTVLSLALLAGAPAATAAMQWNVGTSETSEVMSCLGFAEPGAGATASYQADPQALPKPGERFYGRVVFGAVGGCVDQHAQVEFVLPSGVSIAPDAAHPIRCSYTDDNDQTEASYPDCPARPSHGTYGLAVNPTDQPAWPMPRGRAIAIDVPLVTTRELRGPAGGPCPETLGELTLAHGFDCLVTAVHIADGSLDPWLLPDVQLITAPGAAPAPHAPAGGLSVRMALRASLHAARRTGLAVAVRGVQGRVRVTVVDARGHVLGRASRRGAGLVRVRLSRRSRPGRVTVRVTAGSRSASRSVRLR